MGTKSSEYKVLAKTNCDKDENCPEIYLKDDCIVVQGKRLAENELADFSFAEDELLVKIPLSLFEAAIDQRKK